MFGIIKFLRSIQFVRRSLLLICLPICVLVLMSGLYCTYIVIDSWDCDVVTNSSQQIKDKDMNHKCNTVIDRMSARILTIVPNRKLVVSVRTASLYNTLLTYLSATYATYNLSLLPLLWLSVVSILSFLITFYVFISYGPLTGINNFEIIPVLLGLHIHPYIMLSTVLNIDLIVSVLSMTLVLKLFRQR